MANTNPAPPPPDPAPPAPDPASALRWAAATNQSGYGIDLDKLDAIPDSVIDETDGYREGFGQTAAEASRIFQVYWGGRHPFREWALGYSFNNAGNLKRIIPAQHPEMPWLFAQDCELIGVAGVADENANVVDSEGGKIMSLGYFDNGSRDSLDRYEKWGVAKYRVVYRTLPYAVRSDARQVDKDDKALSEIHRYVERQDTWSLKTLAAPNSLFSGNDALKFAEGPAGILNQPIDRTGTNKLFPFAELDYTWHQVPDVPQEAIDSCRGGVNAEPFDVPWLDINGNQVGGARPGGWARGTLLFMGERKQRRVSVTGRVLHEIVYKFLFRPEGWNKFLAADLNFYLATLGGDQNGVRYYKEVEMDNLFTQPPTARQYVSGAG